MLVYQLSSSGNISTSQKLYYDATIDYFGSTHLPYAILAVVVLVVFVLLPVLILMLYPFRWFQKILNVLPVRWHVLHTFMDSFQGCYKDGTEPGTRDCRWFVSFFFIVRCILFIASILTSYFPIGSIVLTLFALSLIVVQPFKTKFSHYSTINAIYLLFLALWYAAMTGTYFSSTKYSSAYQWIYLAISIAFLPLLYVSLVTLKWIIHHRKFGLEVFRRLLAARHGYEKLLQH